MTKVTDLIGNKKKGQKYVSENECSKRLELCRRDLKSEVGVTLKIN